MPELPGHTSSLNTYLSGHRAGFFIARRSALAVRNLSAAAMRELFAQHSGAAMLMCLTFTHASLSEPIRIVNNTQNVTYNGNVYIALPFEADLPDDVEDRMPSLEVRIDNVERTLVELLRTVVDDLPGVQIDVVRVKNGSVTREIGPLSLSLMSHDINVDTVTLQIGLALDILNEPATQEILNPGLAPGLFA